VQSLVRRRPSPALVISLIALFVSLSGVSYGVATGFIDSREIKNNEVRSIDLRNNQVRTRDLRNNEVRGLDIRNSTVRSRDVGLNALIGDDINESRLGKVPSAAAADSAASAASAQTAASAQSVASLRPIPRTTLAEGASPVTLLTHGPLTFSAACVGNGAATDAVLRVATTEASSSADGSPNPAIMSVPALDPGDGAQAVAVGTTGMGGQREVTSANFVASAPSGRAFSGQAGLIADGAGGGSCVFHGHAVLQG
jgi:hypothetical protein